MSRLDSISITIVIGASVGPKFVIVCGTPSSKILKFSFFKPVRMSPCCVVAITSSVTIGTSTEIDSPDSSGFFCAGAGCCAGGGGGPLCCCSPLCGPAGACAFTGNAPSASTKTAIDNPITIFAFSIISLPPNSQILLSAAPYKLSYLTPLPRCSTATRMLV